MDPKRTAHQPQSFLNYLHPYFTPAEVQYLSGKQSGKLSATQLDRATQHACAFIEAVGSRIGFPRKTIATAQNLYHRFHLFFPRKDFSYNDVSLAALYVSTKMHDTLKKPRELLVAAYAVRPELAAKAGGHNGEVDMDSPMVEHDRQRLLAVERLILETICFNFTSRMAFPYVIKVGKAFGASKKLTKLAWRLCIDCYRTLAPLQYPPHSIALGSLYAAALLLSFEQPDLSASPEYSSVNTIVATLGQPGEWEEKFQAQVQDLEEIVHMILDLLIHGAQSSANTSPRTPSSPSSNITARHTHHPPPPLPAPWKEDQLMRLKIALRENEHPPRPKQPLGNSDPSALYDGDTMLGRNEGTVRFLFGPPRVVGYGV